MNIKKIKEFLEAKPEGLCHYNMDTNESKEKLVESDICQEKIYLFILMALVLIFVTSLILIICIV